MFGKDTIECTFKRLKRTYQMQCLRDTSDTSGIDDVLSKCPSKLTIMVNIYVCSVQCSTVVIKTVNVANKNV